MLIGDDYMSTHNNVLLVSNFPVHPEILPAVGTTQLFPWAKAAQGRRDRARRAHKDSGVSVSVHGGFLQFTSLPSTDHVHGQT